MKKSKYDPSSLLAVELPDARAARKFARRLAEELAEAAKAPRGAVVVVTDEHGKKIHEVICSIRPRLSRFTSAGNGGGGGPQRRGS